LTTGDSDGRPVRLWFGARDEADVYLEDELKALSGLDMSIVLSEPTSESRRPSGFVTAALEKDLKALGANALDGARAYLAGPPVMVEAAITIFRAAGLDQSRIHADAFYTEADKAALT
jgi:CDP-4-dehydro-6-deoxyglucose reductase/ferredoxin-NAD(P)+ reductase (naphthalene dioxygenase ferredoxin-specific)